MIDKAKIKATSASVLKATWDFLKRHVRVFYVAICLVLALLMISLISFGIEYERSKHLTLDDEIPSLGVFAYDKVVTPEGDVTYTPLNSDPQIYLAPRADLSFNSVTLNFKNPIPNTNVIQAYYSYNGENLSEPCSVKARVSPDGKTVELILPKDTTYSLIRLDVNCTFTLDTIDLGSTTLIGMARSANVGATLALVVILAILGGVELWFGFYRWLYSIGKAIYKDTVALISKRAIAKFIVRALFILSVITLCVSYTVILMTATMKTGTISYLFFISIITIALFIAEMVLSSRANAPVMFLVITVICGFLLASTLPIEVSNGWDEEYHYARCLDMKVFLFGNAETYSDVYQCERNFVLNTDRFLKNTEDFIFNLIKNDQVEYDRVLSATPDCYKLVGHIPGAIAMAGADATGLNYFAMFIIAKMANVLTYAFVIYLGLKKLRHGALIFSSVCLIPGALMIASTFTYDYFITAFVCYAFCYFISELQNPEKKFTLKDGILMLGAIIIGSGPKTIYLVLVFPMIFMSKTKFNTKKGVWLYRLACVGAMMIMLWSFILPFISNTASGAVGGDYRGGSDVDTTKQALWILEHPWEYTKILLKFIGEYVSFTNATNMSVALSYAGNAKIIWGTLALCIMAFCAFTDKGECDDFKGSTPLKAVTIFTCFGLTCLIATALYLTFTPVGLYTINGCQWRYIIPVLIPFLYCVGSSKVRHSMDKRVINGLVFGFLTLNVIMSFYDVYVSKIIPLPA
ncbi:MAG: DUF2142 domain-containing protein [Clostridia bacterium]|nr:DUF2142 domain-containing protein [Clostridia bacterium]